MVNKILWLMKLNAQYIHLVYPYNHPSDGHKGITGRNASERKRYRDRERYVTMTPEQRDAYLQRNREYK